MARGQKLSFCAVGDIIVKRDKPESAFTLVEPILKKHDIIFGNCETNYSDRGSRNPICRGGGVRSPRNQVSGVKFAGFNVMSFANNHHLDWGYDAFFDTIDVLKENNIAPVGVGKDEEEARTPVVLERNGTRVAFLAYAPVTFEGYTAGPGKAGSAPMKIYTVYHQEEHEQPGTIPDIHTFADHAHLQAMKEDIAKARKLADVVMVSMHWGLHFQPMKLAEYETQVGRAAIDAGADMILGHHQHILKGIQVYKGKVIFHSLGNFIIDAYIGEHIHSPSLRELIRRYPGTGLGLRPGYPSYPFAPDARTNIIARCEISGGKVGRVSFMPCLINRKGAVEPLKHKDKKFDKAVKFMEDITKGAGFDTKFSVEGGEVVIAT